METSSLTWLAADYHLPATYSCRVPMSSQTCALVRGAPGPATVRLALIRTCIEVFGHAFVERVLFPHIRAIPVHIRPPERVAISPQVLRAYKVEDRTETLIEAPVSREMAHAEGPVTIYLEIPLSLREPFSQVLSMIGYWGKASGLAWCQSIKVQAPRPEQCVRPLRLFPEQVPLRPFFFLHFVGVPRSRGRLGGSDAGDWYRAQKPSSSGCLCLAAGALPRAGEREALCTYLLRRIRGGMVE